MSRLYIVVILFIVAIVPSKAAQIALAASGDEVALRLTHIWDCKNAATVTEQDICDFATLLDADIDFSVKEQSINVLMDRLDADCRDTVVSWLETYLYGWNSALRNEECYAVVLTHLVNDPRITDEKKLRPEFQLEEIATCAPGGIAPDFVFQLPDGSPSSLYSVINQNLGHNSNPSAVSIGDALTNDDASIDHPLYLIIFYDPECSSCSETIEAITASSGLSSLTIMAIATDTDPESWQEQSRRLPQQWIKGFASQPVDDQWITYATPSIYLVGHDATIIQKLTNLPRIRQYLTRLE